MPETHDAPQLITSLIQDLAELPDPSRTLESIVELAVATIPGCDWAGVSLRTGKKLTTPAATAAIVEQVDEAQYEYSQGPCIDSVWADDCYLVEDMAKETRWPKWAPAAHRLGVGSSLSVRLATTDETVGALNLYAATPDAFDDDDVQIAHAVAEQAAAALVISREVSGLRSALQSRHRIGAAQGILRSRHGITMEQAFQVLVRISRDHNVRLRDLAEIVVEANGLPARFVGE